MENKQEEKEFVGGDPNQKLNAFFGELEKNPSDDLLICMENFLESHCKNLYTIQELFAQRMTVNTWNSQDDFLSLDVAPYENVDNPVVLIEDRTDNVAFNKITTALSALCQEMIDLQKLARDRFYNPLTMYGVIPPSADDPNGANATNTSTTNTTTTTNKESKNETNELQMGKFLPFLQDLNNFVNRVYAVVKNTVEQMAFLYDPKAPSYIQTYKNVHMDYLWNRLSQTLTILVTLDAIIQDNIEMRNAWEQYKKMIGYVRGIWDKMGIDGGEEKLNDFQYQMVELENNLLRGTIYDNCIQQKFGVLGKVPYHLTKSYETFQKQTQTEKEEQVKLEKNMRLEMEKVIANRALYEEVLRYLKFMKLRIRNELVKNKEFHHRETMVGMFALYGMVNHVFKHVAHQDKMFYRDAWSIQKIVPLVHLTGRAVWYLSDFVSKYIPYNGKEKELDPQPSKIKEFRKNLLQELDDEFNEKVQSLYLKMCDWMIQWDTETTNKDIFVTLRKETRLLIDGLVLASQIQNLLTTTLFLHLGLQVNFRRANLRSLSVCAELLKSIEGAFHRRAKRLSANVSYMLTVIAVSLQKIYDPIRKKLGQLPRPSSMELDCLAALSLCTSLLNTAPTLSRLVVINVSSCVCTMKRIMTDEKVDEVRYTLWKLDTVANWQQYMRKLTDCSVFYWAIDFIPTILSDIFDTPENAYRLPTVFSYLNDPVPMLKQNAHELNPEHIFQVYNEEILRFLDKEIISELCKAIENDLRIQVMMMMNEKSTFGSKKKRNANMNEFLRLQKGGAPESSTNNVTSPHAPTTPQAGTGVNKGGVTGVAGNELYESRKDYGKFILLKPFRVLNDLIDIKKRVEHYMNKTFYNMATVALHQWEVYAEMKSLAKKKYGLDLVETHLPTQSHFSEGLDVLEVMRNIHVFVSRYNYNLNMQIFVERAFDQLHLNSFDVPHVANSIRTHGPGIVSTAVNFAYQFCASKFVLFHEFLYDDHIKSHLIRDVRMFRDKKQEWENRYPFAQAKQFVAMIRTFGEDGKGQTFLDHFRTLITQIGNALGYVRMIRSGLLYYTSTAMEYVPDVDEVAIFSDYVKEANLSTETIQAAEILDSVLKTMSHSFAEGADYLQMLVSAFEKLLETADQTHLRNFVAIMPPLTYNFVESQIGKKDRLNRKPGKDEAGFTDDGFALGCAFILRVLKLYDEFDALHWWDEVNSQMNKQDQVQQANAKADKNRKEEDEVGSWEGDLSFRRNKLQKSEWKLLIYSFQAARIFFRNADVKKEEANNPNKDNQSLATPRDDNPNANVPPQPPVQPAPLQSNGDTFIGYP